MGYQLAMYLVSQSNNQFLRSVLPCDDAESVRLLVKETLTIGV